MTQKRLSLSSMIAAAAAVAALGLPGMASAAYEHPANNEQRVIVHPEHFKSEKTREQVIAETKAAMQQRCRREASSCRVLISHPPTRCLVAALAR